MSGGEERPGLRASAPVRSAAAERKEPISCVPRTTSWVSTYGACMLQNYTQPLMGFLPLYLVPLSALYALSLCRVVPPGFFPFSKMSNPRVRPCAWSAIIRYSQKAAPMAPFERFKLRVRWQYSRREDIIVRKSDDKVDRFFKRKSIATIAISPTFTMYTSNLLGIRRTSWLFPTVFGKLLTSNWNGKTSNVVWTIGPGIKLYRVALYSMRQRQKIIVKQKEEVEWVLYRNTHKRYF